MKTCGDPRIRRSDKVGLLTRAIDLITGMRQQLGIPPPLGAPSSRLSSEDHPALPTRRSSRRTEIVPTQAQRAAAPVASGLLTRSASLDLTPAVSVTTNMLHHSSSLPANVEKHSSSSGNGNSNSSSSSTQVRRRGRSARTSTQWIPVSMLQSSQEPTMAPLLQQMFASSKVHFTIMGYLNPLALEGCRGVNRQWRRVHSHDLPWKRLCQMRWKVQEELTLEELRPSSVKSWRQVTDIIQLEEMT